MRKLLWTEEETLQGFGSNPFDVWPDRVVEPVSASRKQRLRDGIASRCLNEPGVYGMFDADGLMIYVGKSKQLRTRLLSYFTPGARSEKAGRIIRQTRQILWEPTGSEFGALLRELHLIQTRRPRLNVKDQPRRMRSYYVCIGRPNAAGLYVTARPAAHVEAAFGPFRAGRNLNTACEALNRRFGLRDCTNSVVMRFADQPQLIPVDTGSACLRYDIGTCLAPCVGGCSRLQYRRAVGRARRFLEGSDNTVLADLQAEMQQAAADRLFEKAGKLRDELESLSILRYRLDRLALAQKQFTFVYVQGETTEQPLWYLIRSARVVGVVKPPACKVSSRVAKKQIEEQLLAKIEPENLASMPPDTLMLVSSWFDQQPDRLQQTLCPKTALQHCRRKPK